MLNRTIKSAGWGAAVAATLFVSACSLGGLNAEAKAVADACAKVPGTTVSSCECYARELQSKLNAQQMTAAAAAQTNPGKLLDPEIIGNLSANDVMAVTGAMGAALKTCKITS